MPLQNLLAYDSEVISAAKGGDDRFTHTGHSSRRTTPMPLAKTPFSPAVLEYEPKEKEVCWHPRVD